MSVEMISGPDLGGGYLHQLTIERGPDPVRFTHHIQEGGADASGPPPGDPVPFGFERAVEMCPFGGRRCWHRDYRVPASQTNLARAAYNRWRFVASAMLAQEYGGAARPVATALADLVDRIGPVLDLEGLRWYVGGSTAAFVRGVDIAPRDIDVGCDRSGAVRIAQVLETFLIEPFARTEWPRVGERWAARAFLGTLKEGMRVEWAGAAGPHAAHGSEREWSESPPPGSVERVVWNGRAIPVSPLEFALLRFAEQGEWERVANLIAGTDRSAWNLDRLDDLVVDSPLDAPGRSRLRGAVAR
ncbi:MAG: hypothetical protein ACREDK_04275 [Thermoplasmata archaeon]